MAKKGKIEAFEFPIIGVDYLKEFDVMLHEEGHSSVMFEITNNITQYSGDESLYQNFHNTFTNILKSFQTGYFLQKHDIFCKKIFHGQAQHDEYEDFLHEEYFKNFDGKEHKTITTYLTITKEVNKGFFTYNKNSFKDFINILDKIKSILSEKGFHPRVVRAREFDLISKRFLGFNFSKEKFSLSNFEATKQEIIFGRDKFVQSKTLIDVSEIDLPNYISPSTTKNLGYQFPVDLLSFLNEIEDYEELVYHQMIYVPEQKSQINQMEGKKRKHSSMPGPGNSKCVEDIENVQFKVSNEKQLIVYAHFNIITSAKSLSDLNRISNFIDSCLFDFGVIPSKSNENQLELFKGALPGNASFLKEYDRFWTTSDPMLCFLFKERLQNSQEGDFNIYFSDRQGVPVSIDTWEKPQEDGLINNRNAFVLGPSGTGKSFLTNHKLRQYANQGVDIVIVDTGHSYQGLCQYEGGRYITYSEENPITMNPFKINRAEYNEEKREFLKSVIAVLWKGTNVELDQVEDSAIIGVIKDYYAEFFGETGKVTELSFNTFYDYAIVRLEEVIQENKISFALNNFKFILKKFYKGGEYETILNNDLDRALFDERFVVFEIDAIKEHKTLFPITTLIIMDLFIQKMRLKSDKKVLIIEEAWKAIASPTMAGYILYLYKTVRKFNGQVTVVTQELGDILGNEIVKDSILGNSDILYLLDQSKFRDNYNEVAKLLNLNEVEQNKIFTINSLDNKKGRGKFKEVYVKIGNEGQVFGVEVSLAEYFAYTTERAEKEALRVYIESMKSVKEALKAFIYDLKNSGLKTPMFIKGINRNKAPLGLYKSHQIENSPMLELQ